MVVQELRELTKKKHLFVVKSGDHAIKYTLRLVKQLGKQLLIQDQGGWLTYMQFAEKNHLPLEEVKTYFGLVLPVSLEEHHNKAFLINSMPGYAALQEMQPIASLCAKNQLVLINDVSGSIGTAQATVGDILLGSFGKDKPLNLHQGGFIATNNEEFARFFEAHADPYRLDEAAFAAEVRQLNKKRERWAKLRSKVVKQLENFRIIHPHEEGINVIVAYVDDFEKKKLIKYCDRKKYPYTECPRYIRVLENAISIELKRIQ